MQVLVSAGSRHGSTKEIATLIARTLEHEGIESQLIDPADAINVSDFDALIIGSAIYMGQWLVSARELLERVATQVTHDRIWLFSSGLADSPSKEANSADKLTSKIATVSARGHRHFPGKLDVLQLSIAERAAILAARGKYGDRRDMQVVAEWAKEIAKELKSAQPKRDNSREVSIK